MNARLVILAGLAAACAARAEVPEVVSPRPDAVSVTIYRDLFALITETRTVDLPEGPVMLSFDGVVETLLPASAVVTETGRTLEERNYDFERLTPSVLFRKSVGREVLLTRTHRRSGKVVQVPATIVSAGADGIVLRTGQGNEALHCSGLPERASFERIPDDLLQKPRLSVQLAPGPAGRRTVRVSYLAHGFSWKSDYVARLADAGERIDLKGWVTLRNFTQTGFRDAQVQVVAGRLNLLDAEERGTSLLGSSEGHDSEEGLRYARDEKLAELIEADAEAADDYDQGLPQLFAGCFPVPPSRARQLNLERQATSMVGTDDLAEVIVTGFRASMAVREELADYQMYRLPWRTDLAAHQTKQALFLDKRAIEAERFYGFQFDADDYDDEDDSTPTLRLGFENRKSSGLGEPLPEGVLRLFEPGPTGDLFSGEGTIYDTAVAEPVEIPLAGAVDLHLEIDVTDEQEDNLLQGTSTRIGHVEIRIANAKRLPVTVEIRQEIDADMENATIARASHRTFRKHGDYAWRVRVPANAADTLTYELRQVEED